MKGKFVLVLGGTRSGKSEFAEKIADKLGKRVIYVATATPGDKEMDERIFLHRKRRPDTWETVEETIEVLDLLRRGEPGDVFLLDCLSLWITNLLLDGEQVEQTKASAEKELFIMDNVRKLADTVKKGVHLVVVSSEVGLGLVPDNPLGRMFRDFAGKANQVLAESADKVYFIIAGIPLELK